MRFRTGATDAVLLCAMPLGLLFGAWMVGKLTVDHLLAHDAAMTGQGWATYLADNVKDLDQIAAGQPPTEESRRFFERVQKVGQVFRYAIFDPDGRLRFASNGSDDDNDKDAGARNPRAVRAIVTNGPVVNAEEPDADEAAVRPPFFAEAYVPVMLHEKFVGVVETYVDQTEKRNAYRAALVIMSAALTLLMAFAFGIPAFAFLRRSREKRVADARIHFLAHHDALTGLINRDRLAETVMGLLAHPANTPNPLALHYLDIDNFKDVNDTLGHDAGDALIAAVAQRLQTLVGPHDSVARVGGDEFVVVQTEWANEAGAAAFASELVRELARAFDINGHRAAITLSVGVAVVPGHGDSFTRLMKSADLALYRSKTLGRNTMTLFSPDMDQELAERLRLERALRHAVEADGFELHFQPAVEMPDRRLVGFEALIRMLDEAGGLVPPAAFIPLAEKMGLIDQIGTWVLREACREAVTWPGDLKIAVNLSPAQLATGRLAQTVADILAETRLDPRRLELEITEGMLLEDGEGTLSELRKLKALQVGIVMDDFGTGYSSLRLPLEVPVRQDQDRSSLYACPRQGQ